MIAHKIKLLIKINVLFTFFYFYSFSFQQISKPSYLFFELTDQLAIGIFIHHSLTDDLFGSIRIPEKEKKCTVRPCDTQTPGMRFEPKTLSIRLWWIKMLIASWSVSSRINLPLASSFTTALQTICLVHSAYL